MATRFTAPLAILFIIIFITDISTAQKSEQGSIRPKNNNLSVRIGGGMQLTHVKGINYSAACNYSIKYFSAVIGFEYFGSDKNKRNTLNQSHYLLTTGAFFAGVGLKVKIKKFILTAHGGGFLGYGWNKYTYTRSILSFYNVGEIGYRKTNKKGLWCESQVSYTILKSLQTGIRISYFKYNENSDYYDVYNKNNWGIQFTIVWAFPNF
ncbi:MAG: hypothetical protein WCM76_12725 [Bacteroidota bacterium]